MGNHDVLFLLLHAMQAVLTHRRLLLAAESVSLFLVLLLGLLGSIVLEVVGSGAESLSGLTSVSIINYQSVVDGVDLRGGCAPPWVPGGRNKSAWEHVLDSEYRKHDSYVPDKTGRYCLPVAQRNTRLCD